VDLADEFVVPLPIEQAFSMLTDLARVAPCLPGAQLDEVEGEEYRGRVRVKVGPITVDYRGTARLVERDEEAHVAVLEASGREARGAGNATAHVRAALHEAGPALTRVTLETSLEVSGRVAQLGRGVLADVSTRMLHQFAENLEADLAAAGPAEPPGGEEDATDGRSAETEVRAAPAAPRAAVEAEPVRAFSVLGPVLLKRLSPLVVLGALVALVRHRRRHVERRAAGED